MQFKILLMALAASAALMSPCLYAIDYHSKSNHMKTIQVGTLDTSVFDLVFVDVFPGESMWDVTIRGVCNIGPYWDYTFYRISRGATFLKNFQRISSTETEGLTPRQREFVKAKKYFDFEFKLSYHDWIVGISTVETVFLSKNPTDDRVYLVGGSRKVFEDMNMKLSGQTPLRFIEGTGPERDEFQFPDNLECALRYCGGFNVLRQEDGLNLHLMASSSDIQLVERWNFRGEIWTKVEMLKWPDSDTMYLPNEAKGYYEPEEKRIYVGVDEETSSIVEWWQDNHNYLMTVISKPRDLLQHEDMSEFEIVSSPDSAPSLESSQSFESLESSQSFESIKPPAAIEYPDAKLAKRPRLE